MYFKNFCYIVVIEAMYMYMYAGQEIVKLVGAGIDLI